jgi:hypothetical protein
MNLCGIVNLSLRKRSIGECLKMTSYSWHVSHMVVGTDMFQSDMNLL